MGYVGNDWTPTMDNLGLIIYSNHEYHLVMWVSFLHANLLVKPSAKCGQGTVSVLVSWSHLFLCVAHAVFDPNQSMRLLIACVWLLLQNSSPSLPLLQAHFQVESTLMVFKGGWCPSTRSATSLAFCWPQLSELLFSQGSGTSLVSDLSCWALPHCPGFYPWVFCYTVTWGWIFPVGLIW